MEVMSDEAFLPEFHLSVRSIFSEEKRRSRRKTKPLSSFSLGTDTHKNGLGSGKMSGMKSSV